MSDIGTLQVALEPFDAVEMQVTTLVELDRVVGSFGGWMDGWMVASVR